MLSLLLSLALLAPPQRAVTADPSSPKRTQVAPASTWAASNGPSASDPFTAVTLIESNADASALLTVSELNELELATHDGSSWSSLDTLTADVGGTSGFYADGAYEARSGRLLVVYRKGVSSQVYYRVYDAEVSPALSGENWYDLALPSAPARLLLVPRPGSDEILLVAVSATSIRTALWDGTDFTDPTTQESVFANGPEAVSGAWQGSECVLLWARATDSTPRGSRFDGTNWNTEFGLPSCVHPIARLELAPSSDRAARPLLLTAITFDGADYALRVAVRDDTAWSGVSTLSSALAGADAASAAWQPSGDAAAAVWQASGATTLSVSHYEDTGWSPPVTTSDLGGIVERVLVRPATGLDAAVRTLASVTVESDQLSDYVLYADSGSIDIHPSTTVNGTSGEDLGYTLPDPPLALAGISDVSVGNNGTVTVAPGDYDDLSIGQNSTVELSAGDTVFDTMTTGKTGLTLDVDTTGGTARFILISSDFDMKTGLTMTVTGTNPFEIHVLSGDFIATQNAEINASIIVYNGDIEFGNNADIDGHLVASRDITVGNNGTIDPPAWGSPFEDPSPDLVDLFGFTVTAGTPSTPVTIIDDWAETHMLPFDLGWQRPTAGLRITSWREVPSYDPAP